MFLIDYLTGLTIYIYIYIFNLSANNKHFFRVEVTITSENGIKFKKWISSEESVPIQNNAEKKIPSFVLLPTAAEYQKHFSNERGAKKFSKEETLLLISEVEKRSFNWPFIASTWPVLRTAEELKERFFSVEKVLATLHPEHELSQYYKKFNYDRQTDETRRKMTSRKVALPPDSEELSVLKEWKSIVWKEYCKTKYESSKQKKREREELKIEFRPGAQTRSSCWELPQREAQRKVKERLETMGFSMIIYLFILNSTSFNGSKADRSSILPTSSRC